MRYLGSLVLIVRIVQAGLPGPPGPGDRAGEPLSSAAVAQLGRARFRQGTSIRQVVYTPIGRTLVPLGDDGVIRL
jgi:hypothetical protein